MTPPPDSIHRNRVTPVIAVVIVLLAAVGGGVLWALSRANVPAPAPPSGGTPREYLVYTSAGGSGVMLTPVDAPRPVPAPPGLQQGTHLVQAVAPDGQTVVVGHAGELTEHWLEFRRVDGSRQWLLSERKDALDGWVTFSPDGGRVAFNRLVWEEDIHDIYLADVVGGAPRRLTHGGRTNGSRAPAFSPDGTMIAYERDNGKGSRELYVMRADGSGARRVVGAERNPTSPSFTADGTGLYFATGYVNDGWAPDAGLATVRLDGAGYRVLATARAEGATGLASPRLSPSGRHLLYYRMRLSADARGSTSTVCLMDPDGAHPRAVAEGHSAAWIVRME